MLKDFVKAFRPDDAQVREAVKDEQLRLAANQMKIKEAKLPVMVVFEGWSAAGKGEVIGRVIKEMDPRFYRVTTLSKPTETDLRYPFLRRFLMEIPEGGKFTFFDQYWMKDTTEEAASGEITGADYKRRIDSINRAERSLHDNG